MKVRSIACRNGVVLLCVLALMSCSSAVLDDASREPAGTEESAHEPETEAAGPAKPSAPAPPVVAPGAPVAPSEPQGTPEERVPPAHGPTVTVVEATIGISYRANNRIVQETRKVFRFVRTGDDVTQRLVIRFSRSYDGTDSTIDSGFVPGMGTSDYPSRGVPPGVTMAVELRRSNELQPYIDLAGGPQHGFRPYVLGGSRSLTITG